MKAHNDTEKKRNGKVILPHFVLCSLLMTAGAGAGCFSGSFSPTETGKQLGVLSGTVSPASAFFGAMAPIIVTAVLGSSAAGLVLLPTAALLSGFVSGFILAASALSAGGTAVSFLNTGWCFAVVLPPLLVLFTSSLRFSQSMLYLAARGIRPDREVFLDYFKALALAVCAALVTALCVMFFRSVYGE